ncbi:MAG: VaFE repeat-containing surface-anchored protein [Collinsella sp.]
MSTTAKDGADGDKDVSADAEARSSTRSPTRLKAGEAYELSATLVDKATGRRGRRLGQARGGQGPFEPALSTGSQDVEIA